MPLADGMSAFQTTHPVAVLSCAVHIRIFDTENIYPVLRSDYLPPQYVSKTTSSFLRLTVHDRRERGMNVQLFVDSPCWLVRAHAPSDGGLSVCQCAVTLFT